MIVSGNMYLRIAKNNYTKIQNMKKFTVYCFIPVKSSVEAERTDINVLKY